MLLETLWNKTEQSVMEVYYSALRVIVILDIMDIVVIVKVVYITYKKTKYVIQH